MFFRKQPKKIGLALGGGAARGIAHLGVLKAIDDHGIPIHCISGTSSGSLIGGLYAAGVDIAFMIDEVKSLRWLDIAGFHLSKRGMVSSHKIELFVKKLVGSIHIKDLRIPFCAMATDLLTGQGVELKESEMELALAIRASSSFPGVYSPLKYGKTVLIDGGAAGNVPIKAARNMGADYVIAVDVVPNVKLHRIPTNLAIIADRGLDLLLHSTSEHNYKNADLVLTPIKEPIHSFDIKKANRMIALGIAAVEEQLALFKRLNLY